MIKEYKAFLLRSNLLDLAVAFILGAAFSTVVESLARDVIIAPIAGILNFDDVAQWKVGGIAIGSFLAALLSFIVIATVLFFIVRAAARLQSRSEDTAGASEEVVLLREIRDTLRTS
ncbi:MAG: large conductance mechanosensitive channel protein MscL [Egibacteraceae bacterium]